MKGSPAMMAEYVVNSAGYGTLKTDLDGDSVFETVTDLNGSPIVGGVVTYESLYALIQNSTLTKARKTALLVIIRNAEKASKSRLPPKLRKRAEDALLDAGILLVRGYVKRGQISVGEGEQIKVLINIIKYGK